ncbi:MAG: DUF3047 domain-containing protein [Magnetococcales bacterium]|nr:DUF3047 domain-containing protein [Magnetococcales bacterium]MBF0148655.1 DUF3047 domain-containing protein [Magnetococcales bacterium]MBF0346845.1 DUF3047 domain-containing protein [Magnetococcales bacterium]MBF0630896.1 DUF3047 domain-containing protein [Magnetococcales bacterium]
MKRWIMGLVVTGGLAWMDESHAARLTLGDFSSQNLNGWQRKSFQGENQWQFEHASHAPDPDLYHLRVQSNDTAEGMIRKETVDLKQWPILHWSWRVALPLPEGAEQTRAGDDFAARIGIIIADGPFPWQTYSINYVHSSTLPAGTHWQSPYSDHVFMLAVARNGQDHNEWQHFRRNVAMDFKQLFNRDIDRIQAVAIMVDTDNTHGKAQTWFGDVFFSDQSHPPTP